MARARGSRAPLSRPIFHTRRVLQPLVARIREAYASGPGIKKEGSQMARTDAGTAGGSATGAHGAKRSLGHRIGAKFLEEFLHILPPTIYFFLGFNLVLLTKRLMLAQYLIQSTGF